MSEYTEVELPFLQQLAAQGWTVVDQGCAAIPQDPATSLRTSFREWLLPGVFDAAVRRINTLPNGKPWLTDRQLGDLRGGREPPFGGRAGGCRHHDDGIIGKVGQAQHELESI